jgi:hypothetical protein
LGILGEGGRGKAAASLLFGLSMHKIDEKYLKCFFRVRENHKFQDHGIQVLREGDGS